MVLETASVIDLESAFVQACMKLDLSVDDENRVMQNRAVILRRAVRKTHQLDTKSRTPYELRRIFQDVILDVLNPREDYGNYVALMEKYKFTPLPASKFNKSTLARRWKVLQASGAITQPFVRFISKFELREIGAILPDLLIIPKDNHDARFDLDGCPVITYDLQTMLTQLAFEMVVEPELRGYLNEAVLRCLQTRVIELMEQTSNFSQEKAIMSARQAIKEWVLREVTTNVYRSYSSLVGAGGESPIALDDFWDRTDLIDATKVIVLGGLKVGAPLTLWGNTVTVSRILPDLTIYVVFEDDEEEYAMSVDEFCELLEEEVYNNDPCNYRPTQSRMQ